MPSSRTGRAREEARRPRVAGLSAEELPPPPIVGPQRAELDRATGQLHRAGMPDAAMAGPAVAVETQVLLARRRAAPRVGQAVVDGEVDQHARAAARCEVRDGAEGRDLEARAEDEHQVNITTPGAKVLREAVGDSRRQRVAVEHNRPVAYRAVALDDLLRPRCREEVLVRVQAVHVLRVEARQHALVVEPAAEMMRGRRPRRTLLPRREPRRDLVAPRVGMPGHEGARQERLRARKHLRKAVPEARADRFE
mmetsp:Transcript_23285/g.69654  ORF Transcript_23285/g.69654 Transcript_23285/m.69654 type:complete len:252 (+) Transcript_23285:131-886(+)